MTERGWHVRTPGLTPDAVFTGPDAERQAREFARRLRGGVLVTCAEDDTFCDEWTERT